MRDGLEMHRAVRVLLLDVMEQCARHIESCPHGRDRLDDIAKSAHDCLVQFEIRSQSAVEGGLSQRGPYRKVQDRVLDWLIQIQDIRRDTACASPATPVPEWAKSAQSDHQAVVA